MKVDNQKYILQFAVFKLPKDTQVRLWSNLTHNEHTCHYATKYQTQKHEEREAH